MAHIKIDKWHHAALQAINSLYDWLLVGRISDAAL